MLRIVLGLLFVPLFAFAIDPKSAPVPVAKQVPQVIEQHGEKRSDPFFWIKSKTDADVLKYLKTENDYTLAVMKPTDALQKKLYDEYLSRIQQTDRDVPWRDRGYWYYTRTEEGKQYPIVCRKKGNLEAVEEIMLDGNVLGKDEKFFAVGKWRVSDDGHLLAYSTDTTGFREYELSVRNLRTGKLVESKLVKAPGFEWAGNTTLFYTTEDDAKRASKVWRHTLGQPRDKDVMVFEEKDEEFWIEMARSRDGQYLFHSSVSFGSTEQWYLPANKPTDPWKVILPRQADIEYQAGHRDGQFYIVTNKGATNFKVVTCPVGQTENPAAFVDLMPYDRQVFIEGIALFQNFAVLTVRTNGLPGLIVRDLKSGATHSISFDEPTWDVSLGQNPEFDVSSIRFTYSSMLTPESEFEYDLTTKSRKLLKKKEVPNYDPANYQIERISATASDGTKVPVSLIYRKGLKRDGSAPCLLYGYGSYGLSMPDDFDSKRFSLLDRGVIYAIAHIRGGSELGRTWYDDGKMLKKLNTFNDFIAAADFLVAEKYCSRDRLAIQGGSAGGLLIATVLNMRPDLCKVALLQVPFVDALTTMSDASLPLTVQEYRQWGNPNIKAEYDYMRKYCPYTNLKKANYPSMLLMTSLNDSQVLFHEPTKYVAKLRTLRTDANPLLLRCNMDAGHGGASGRYDNLKEEAFEMAFILDQIGAAK